LAAKPSCRCSGSGDAMLRIDPKGREGGSSSSLRGWNEESLGFTFLVCFQTALCPYRVLPLQIQRGRSSSTEVLLWNADDVADVTGVDQHVPAVGGQGDRGTRAVDLPEVVAGREFQQANAQRPRRCFIAGDQSRATGSKSQKVSSERRLVQRLAPLPLDKVPK